MLIEVQKQVKETLEVKTPCYYKSLTGHHFINDIGMITVNDRMVSMWSSADGKYFNEDVARIVGQGKPCEKEEFNKAYANVIAKRNPAVGVVEANC